jgi:murein DD-endopeptidase MepM/ murein hydrolase activator NlpD
MSQVYAAAPGIATYAGYRGAYGKVVEIECGNGIATRYGHLHRYTVSVGQRVETCTQIGLLGSTGHASDPHVHYEVIVNGQPQDPEKFIELARLVPIAESSARVRSFRRPDAQRAKSLASENAELRPT